MKTLLSILCTIAVLATAAPAAAQMKGGKKGHSEWRVEETSPFAIPHSPFTLQIRTVTRSRLERL